MLLIVVAAGIVGAVYAFAGNMQAATLWASRKLSPAGNESMMPEGIQDAITPPWLTRLNILWMVGLLAILVGGSLSRWYLGILGIVLFIFFCVIIEKILPKQLAAYIRHIAVSLANREADYRKANDAMRADAAHDFLLEIHRLLEQVTSSGQLVPSIREARITPIGMTSPPNV